MADNNIPDEAIEDIDEEALFAELVAEREGKSGGQEDDQDQVGDQVGTESGPGQDQDEADQVPEPTIAEQLAQEREAREKLEHQFRSESARQAALQKKLADARTKIEELERKPKLEDEAARSKRWAAIKEDYGDLAEGIEAKFGGDIGAVSARLAEFDSLRESVQEQQKSLQKQQQDLYKSQQAQRLAERHSDFRDVVTSTEFSNWSKVQPTWLQEKIANSVEADDAIYILDTYKSTLPKGNGDVSQRRQEKLKSAQSIPSRGTRQDVSASDEEALFNEFARRVDARNKR